MKNKPPKISNWLLSKIQSDYAYSPTLGDLEEEFLYICQKEGIRKAKYWYRWQVIKSIPSSIKHKIYWSFIMLKNYLKISFRNLKKQKVYSVITISGLALGLAVFILFALMSNFLGNFDRFHEKAERIYSVVQVFPGGIDGDQHSAITPSPLLPALKTEFPEIEKVSRFYPQGRTIVKYQDKIIYENGIKFADPDFLSIFTFEMKMGNAETALSKPYSAVLTEKTASKYFGNENPIGKFLSLDNKIDVIVTGITKNAPKNSTVNFNILVSMETANSFYSWIDDWKEKKQGAFLLLSKGVNPNQLEEKFPTIINKYYADSPDSPKRLYLFPLPDFFLKSTEIEKYWISGGASFTVLWVIAVLLLVIACINFMNLSTARYVTRANEVGMRKVIGANRFHLIKQFLGESTLLTFISLPLALLFFELIRPAFVAYVDNSVDISIWDKPQILILTFVVTILTGIFAGSYPAFFLSAFKPIQVLKGKIQSGKKGGRFRKISVVVQFSFSIILILITIVSIKQANHNSQVDLGYNRNQVISVEIVGEAHKNLNILKEKIMRHKDVISVSASSALPIEWDTKQQALPDGAADDEKLNMNYYGIDYDFIEILDLKIYQGRSFSIKYEDANNFILNETAVKQLKWDKPIGKQLTIGDKKGTVIGIVKNFHFKSIYLTEISPTVLALEPEKFNYLLIKYSSSGELKDVRNFIGQQWNILTPDLPFESTTLNDFFQEVNSGDKTAETTGALGVLAIFLSCMGLLGLTSFAVEQRIKEIGIRKVLGASVSRIIKMLTINFLKSVVLANIIAIPIAYLLMNRMINFLYAYPIKIGLDIFILTAGITLLVAFMTVTSQTLKAARANPSDSLKYE